MDMEPEFDDYEETVEAMADDATIKKVAEGITITLPPDAMEQVADAAAAKIRTAMEQRLDKLVKAKVDEVCNEAWKASVFDRAKAAADAYLSKPRTPTNQWGEPEASKKPIAFHEQIPVIVDQWLNQMVDDKGNADRDSYGASRGKTKRLDWMMRSIVTEPLRSETERAAKTVEQEARKVVAAHVGRFVAEQMIPAIDIKALNN